MKRLIAVVIIVFVFNPVVWAQPVYFADANLKAKVEAELGVTNPTAADMLSLTYLLATSRDISDLTGLEYATNLKTLNLRWNLISDLSPLSGLTHLKSLSLDGNQISDISPLSGLTHLTDLYLRDNQIRNLSGLSSGLTNLVFLYLEENQISDISPLSGLPNLDDLFLSDNQISDISPLAGMDLGFLFLEGNPLCQEACDIYIPQMEANGTFVVYAGCAFLPDVVGMTESEAEAALTAAGFSVGRKRWGPSDAPTGTVFDQDPAGGQTRQAEIEVNLTFSQGPGDGPPGPVPPVPVPPGASCLVAHWKLDETEGVVANDSSGQRQSRHGLW